MRDGKFIIHFLHSCPVKELLEFIRLRFAHLAENEFLPVQTDHFFLEVLITIQG